MRGFAPHLPTGPGGLESFSRVEALDGVQPFRGSIPVPGSALARCSADGIRSFPAAGPVSAIGPLVGPSHCAPRLPSVGTAAVTAAPPRAPGPGRVRMT